MSDFNTAPLPERMLMAPHADALGLTLISIDKGRGVMSVPWREELVGDPETGVIASGVVTALIDHTCGLAINSAMATPQPIATLDLRIDYLRAAEPRHELVGLAECYKLTNNVAFVRGSAWDRDRSDPFASMLATFMLVGPLQPGAWQEAMNKGPEDLALPGRPPISQGGSAK